MPPIAKQLRAKLGHILRRSSILPKGAKLLVAVSGGQDSLCLLQLLVWWQKTWHWQIVVGHCNHRWRADASANADHVQQLAEDWGLAFALTIADPIPTSEASARSWRYRALANLAVQHQCQYIVTGHTLSDRAETLLYNLIRGSGSGGLGAMVLTRPLEPNSPLQLVRPLLEITRQETGAFCHALQLPIYWDTTNDCLDYRRNRIRHELMPYLQHHFNPQIETALAQTAHLLHEDHQYLEALAQNYWLDHDLSQPQIDRLALRPHPPALQTRIIRQFLQHHLGQEVDYRQVKKIQHLLTAPNQSQSDPFCGHIVAIVQHPYICLKMLS